MRKLWLLAVAMLIMLALLALASCTTGSPTQAPTSRPTNTPTVPPTAKPTDTQKPATPTQGPTTAPGATGKIEVRVTDAPPPGVTKVMVTAKSIQAHMSGTTDDSWVTLLTNPPAFDLVAVAGIEQVLGSNSIPVGDYTQVRIDIDKVVITSQNKDMTADVPSDRVRLVSPFSITQGQTTTITLDFDADKSVVLSGSEKAQFKPVVKMVVKGQPSQTPTASGTPTTKPTETEKPPFIPHPVAGQENCVLCHSASGIKPFPKDHAGRTNDLCQACHQSKPGGTPTVAPTPTVPAGTPAATPTTAPPTPTVAATPTQASGGGIPNIPHPVAGRESCRTCHETGMTTEAVPANHAGRTNATCQLCHKPTGSVGGAPNIPHTLDGRSDCLMCHAQKLVVPKFPTNHASFSNAMCTACHKAS